MELFFIIGLGITIIVILTGFRSETKKRFIVVNKRIVKLQNEIETQLGNAPLKESVPVKPIQSPAREVISAQKSEHEKPKEEPIAEEKKPAVVIAPPVKAEEKKPEAIETPKKETPAKAAYTAPVEKVNPIKSDAPVAMAPTEKAPKDYEKLIGENWLNKIGIAILVIGIGFFVKYAIDQNWIGEIGRVMIGIGTGAGLIGIAYFLRTKYRAFSSVLIGGGLSIFYYTISIAYHDYQIFSQTAAFGIMSAITLLSTLLAVKMDRKELAIIALIGGFSSPFMVQGETANHMAFFSYVAILNMGMLLLSYFKKWDILQKLSLGFTLLFFGAWLLIEPISEGPKLYTAFLFSSIYFIQFLGMSMIYNLRNRIKFNAWEFIQMLSIISLYYAAMMYLLSFTGYVQYQGAFTLSLAGLLGGVGYLVKINKNADENMATLLMGNVITLVTIFGMVQLKGNHMALYWSVEAVLLLFIGNRFKMAVLRNASVIVTAISFLGLIKMWFFTYVWGNPIDRTLMFNESFVTAVFALLSYVGTLLLLRKDTQETIFFVPVKVYKGFLQIVVLIGTYLTGLFELGEHMDLGDRHGEELVVFIYNMIFLSTGVFLAAKSDNYIRKVAFLIIAVLGLVGYFGYAAELQHDIVYDSVAGLTGNGFFILHFVLTGVMAGLLFFSHKLLTNVMEAKENGTFAFILVSLIALFVGCIELELIAGKLTATSTGDLYIIYDKVRVAGYTVLGGIFSFIMMIYGMRKKERVIRIFALVSFGATLIKLFLFDIQNISEGGKIVAFISLGALLLVVSFLYQKLKNLIVDGEFEKIAETPDAKKEVELK